MVGCVFPAALALSLLAVPKIAVLPISHGEGVPDTTTEALTESLAAEVRKTSGAEVVTKREIESVLSLEMQKQMLGCQTDSCMAELGGALGVDILVTGDVARLGQSWLVHFKVVKASKAQVVSQADRRIRGGTIDDVLDVLPDMVRELFPGAKKPPPSGTVAAVPPLSPPPPPPPAVNEPLKAPFAQAPPAAPGSEVVLRQEQPLSGNGDRSRLVLFGDGQRHVVAVVPFAGPDSLLFAGHATRLYNVRVVGGAREGKRAFEIVFWDPRFTVGARRRLSVVDGRATLTCGDREVELHRIGGPRAQLFGAATALLEPPWRRIPLALARDDEGQYYLLDGLRGPKGQEIDDPKSYVLWVGPKSKMTPEKAIVTRDTGGLLAASPMGRLKISRGADGKPRADFILPSGARPLVFLDPDDNGRLIYRELSPYAGQALGTPCDPYIAP